MFPSPSLGASMISKASASKALSAVEGKTSAIRRKCTAHDAGLPNGVQACLPFTKRNNRRLCIKRFRRYARARHIVMFRKATRQHGQRPVRQTVADSTEFTLHRNRPYSLLRRTRLLLGKVGLLRGPRYRLVSRASVHASDENSRLSVQYAWQYSREVFQLQAAPAAVVMMH